MDGWLIGLYVFQVLLIVALIFFMLDYVRVKRQFSILQEQLNHQEHDISGLCSAVDSRMKDFDDFLELLDGRLTEFEQRQLAAEPYQNAIEYVRQGAGAQQLMQTFGLSREEAALLIRLHGAK